MSAPRRSYEALVCVVPIGPDAQRLIAAWGGDATDAADDARVVTAGDGNRRLAAWLLASVPWGADVDGGRWRSFLEHGDIIVFVAGEDTGPVPGGLERLADDARDHGKLVSAVLVAGAQGPQRSAHLAALRQAADMVVVVSDPGHARSFVEALRGGAEHRPP